MAQPWDYLLVLADPSQQRLVAYTGLGVSESLTEELSERRTAQAFHELGEQGWELAGIETSGAMRAYWFKRPA